MTVVVITGDGDAAAIGGNHFIHAARRNIDITVVVFNNSTYGMTSGQYSPLTPMGAMAATAPYGNLEQSFDLCRLAEAAGATYVARSTTFHTPLLPDFIVNAVKNKGFSLVEVVTACPVYYGRMNKMSDPATMMKWQQQSSVNVKQASTMTPEEMKGKFIVGEICRREAPEYTEEYGKLIARFSKEKN
jgi:2-oxoglutarate ferredoxin oxidoreductase subunit beta